MSVPRTATAVMQKLFALTLKDPMNNVHAQTDLLKMENSALVIIKYFYLLRDMVNL